MEGLGRFSEPALLVLLSLLEGDRHGHAICNDIEALTGKRPGPGTLYGAIGRLEDRGLIQALDSVDRRKPYRLTEAGHAVVTAELSLLSNIVAVGRQRLRVTPTPA